MGIAFVPPQATNLIVAVRKPLCKSRVQPRNAKQHERQEVSLKGLSYLCQHWDLD